MKYLILKILTLLIVILTTAFFVYFKYLRPKEIFQPVSSTGAVIEPESQGENKQLEIRSKLYNMLPVKEEGFEISYDYSADKFKVVLKNPYEENKQRFTSWLQSQILHTLPKDIFLIVLE